MKISKLKYQISNNKGQILVVVFVALGVVLFTVLSIITGAQIYHQNAQYSTDSEKAVALAEAGIDKAIVSLNKTGGSYNGEQGTSLGEGEYSVTITSQNAATKIIESTGFVPSKEKAKVKRTIKITSSKGVGVAFVYGIQVGEGGLELGNNNQVQGSIYSNGNITAGNNNVITGDAYVAGGPAGSADQQTDCEGSNCTDFLFGKSVDGVLQLDVAQSFKPSISEKLNKISVKIKKFGSPADVTVRIMKDKDGKPDKNNILATGTLYSSLVSTSYGWIDVTFNTIPNLVADTTYWIMIDTSSDTLNYWSWQNDLAQSYARGNPLWSPNWNTGNPSWNIAIGDFSFKVIMGGTITSIRAGNNSRVNGDAHANTIENLIIGKDAYYKTIISSTVGGDSFPNSDDPPPKVFPISDANVLDWQNQATDNGVVSGGISSCVTNLESKKYVGNVIFDNNCTVTVQSPIWITGNLTLNNKNTLRLDSSYGLSSGVIIVDGVVNLGNDNLLQGSSQGSSILMILSSYDSRSTGVSAIKINNTGNSGVFYAHKGIIEPGNNNQYKELTAWQIKLTNDTIINYETGLSSALFSSGPSGSFSLVKGTYQLK